MEVQQKVTHVVPRTFQARTTSLSDIVSLGNRHNHIQIDHVDGTEKSFANDSLHAVHPQGAWTAVSYDEKQDFIHVCRYASTR